MKRIDAHQLAELQQRSDTPPVINVLPEDQYEQKHIPGTINVPFNDAGFVDRVSAQVRDKSDPVVVYCANADCDMSVKAGRRLEEAGFLRVSDFESGVKGWEDAGFPLVGSNAPATR